MRRCAFGAHDGALTSSEGAKRSSSAVQLYTSEAGHTTSVGLRPPPTRAPGYAQSSERFAQAHVVSQNATKAQVFERAEPLVSVDLVATHRCLERCRHRKVHLAERVQALDGTAERSVAIGLERGRRASMLSTKRVLDAGSDTPSSRSTASTICIFSEAKRGASAPSRRMMSPDVRRANVSWRLYESR